MAGQDKKGGNDSRKLPVGTPHKDQDGPMGDAQLTEEAAEDKDVDRSKTPGRAYDV